MTRRETITTEAGEVESGDILPALDNGYVFAEPVGAGDFDVQIWFHTRDGEEAVLPCPSNMPLTVKRSA